MKINRNHLQCVCFLIASLLIIISCNKKEKRDKIDDEKIKKYSIVYTNNSYANLIVFDENDTIYITDKLQYDIQKYIKIKSDPETINEIKETLINHLNYKSLLVHRDFVLHSGYLSVSISYDDKKIELMQSEVDSDLRVSKKIYNLMSNLKEKYKEIDLIF